VSALPPGKDAPSGASASPEPRFVTNVVANWAGQFVIVVSGFILPRLINDRIGQAELGIWDLGWTLRSMVAMSSLGVGSSGGHYVSRFRETLDWPAMNRVLSATLVLSLYAAGVALVITGFTAFCAPLMMPGGQPQELINSTRVIIIAMGAGAALQMLSQVYGGVLVGHQRFDLLNLVEIVENVFLVAALLIAVIAGLGLKALALCVLVQACVDVIAKRMIAYRLATSLVLRPKWRDWATFKEVCAYGGKSVIEAVGSLLTHQVVILLLMAVAGPKAVPLYARPRALIQFTNRFIMGYARVLVPKAGALFEAKKKQELAQLLIDSTRHGLYLSLPLVVLFFILGGPILRVWMGEQYENPQVLRVLVLGFAAFLAQRPTWHILLGVGRHGVASVATFCGAVLTVGLGFLLIYKLEWGTMGAAVAVACPVALVNMAAVPWSGVKVTGVSVKRYIIQGALGPILAVIPYAATLCLGSWWFEKRPVACVLTTLPTAGVILAATYWLAVIPDTIKTKILCRVLRRRQGNTTDLGRCDTSGIRRPMSECGDVDRRPPI
jgi:O-antigen/teichoic acid export membrane protein